MSDGRTVVAMVGYGYWGPNLCRNFLSLDDVRVKYICDTSPERLNEAGKLGEEGVLLVGDIEAVLGDPEVDAVVIASSAVTHFPLARDALLNGKHVMVEKPLSLEVRQGSELVRLSEQLGLVLMVGHLLIYHPSVAYMKDYLTSGRAGKLFYIYSQRLNLGRLRHDENCLWSLAPHDISVMLYLLDQPPVSVSARGASYLRDGLEDVVFCTLYFAEGQVGSLHVSWLDPHKVRRFTIVGSERMIVFDDMQPKDKVCIFDKKAYRKDGMLGYGDELYLHFGEETVPEIGILEPLRLECEHFRDCVRDGKTPMTDGKQGLLVLEVLEAATRSMASGGEPIGLGG